MCIHFLFTYLPLLFLFSFRVLVFLVLCDGCLNVCMVIVSYLYCLVVVWVGVVEWRAVGEVCTIVLCKSCVVL
jgi:hypothetical protein